MSRSRRELFGQTKLGTWLGIGLKLGVIGSCVLGILQHPVGVSQGFMDSIFAAFTTQSNIAVAAMCFVFLWIDLVTRGRPAVPRWLYALKYMTTTSVVLTSIVFAALLTPTVSTDYLVSPSNVLLHNGTPMLALLDFILLDRAYDPPVAHSLLALVLPLAYMVYFFAGYELSGRPPVPYFFLDYKTYGWLRVGGEGIGVVYWVVIVSAGLVGMGAGMLKVKGRCGERPLRCSAMVMGGMVGVSVVSGLISVLLRRIG